MAVITLTTSNNSNMRVDMYYTPAMGGFTITQLNSYRVDGNITQGGSGSGVLWINGAQALTGQSFYFGANYNSRVMWSGSWWVGGTGISITFSGTTVSNILNANFSYTLPSYSCKIGIKQMDPYGAYTLSRTWIDTWGIAGASYSYSGYDNNDIYNKISISGVLNGAVNTNVNASRKKTNFTIEPYLIDKNGEKITPTEWSLDFSDDNGATYETITEVPYDTQYVERPYKIKNIKFKNGGEIISVKNNTTELSEDNGIYSTTQNKGTTPTSLIICLNLAAGGKLQVKTSSGWLEGETYIKTEDGWSKAQKVYLKTANGWQESQAK